MAGNVGLLKRVERAAVSARDRADLFRAPVSLMARFKRLDFSTQVPALIEDDRVTRSPDGSEALGATSPHVPAGDQEDRSSSAAATLIVMPQRI